MATEIERVSRLIERAAASLAKATTAAEILDVRDQADVAYTAAKTAARLTKVKDAHDTVLQACRKAMADALIIETQVQCRLADEYDAAQNRGEARSAGQPKKSIVPKENNSFGPTDIGLTRKQVHEARIVRDAEKAKPGIVRKTVEAKLEANEEPTRADVKRAVKPRSKHTDTNSKLRGGPKPQRRTTTPSVEATAASLVLDQGKTYEQARLELGLSSVQPVKTAVAREEGRREPQIDRSELSISAQQKFDAAIRQHKVKLDANFHEAVNNRVRAFLEETILPKHRAEQEQAKRVMDARKGIMDKATFNKIRRGLHPDSRNSISDKVLAEAFDTFMGLEKLLLNEKDSPTDFAPLPKTMADWDKMKAAATAARRAKRAANATVRPR
jgi:hypothetical protein